MVHVIFFILVNDIQVLSPLTIAIEIHALNLDFDVKRIPF